MFPPTIGRQLFELGLIDEIGIQIAPILLGDGIRLYDNPGSEPIRLHRVGEGDPTSAVNVRYRPTTTGDPDLGRLRIHVHDTYPKTGIFASRHHQPGRARRNPSGKVMAMRQLQVKKIVRREPTRTDPLPVDPRDADVVRAKRRLYEGKAPATPPGR